MIAIEKGEEGEMRYVNLSLSLPHPPPSLPIV